MNIALRKIASKKLHVSEPTWWLTSRFHFSFADYYNKDNLQFGVLRVMNDDIVQANVRNN
jgi:redox-sensitive bicupin YhaK (pirin superfamily)